MRCQRECANGGLVFDEQTRKMRVDDAHCVGCGRCLGACNFDAISFASSNAVKVLNCRMAEYTKAVVDGRPQFHISLVVDVSPNCDCQAGRRTTCHPANLACSPPSTRWRWIRPAWMPAWRLRLCRAASWQKSGLSGFPRPPRPLYQLHPGVRVALLPGARREDRRGQQGV